MKRRHWGQHEDCFGCKILSIDISPKATPTRKNNVPPKVNESANAWERGIVKDDRGMPLLNKGKLVGVKEYANNRGHFEKQRQRLRYDQQQNQR